MGLLNKITMDSVVSYLKHLAVWALLLSPVVVYTRTFGDTLSHDHSRWAEMGSAMSGIYGPILAVLGFAVLALQLQLQQQQTKHMYDQTYIQSANDNIAFYLSKLEMALDAVMADGRTVGNRLQAEFQWATVAQLRTPEFLAVAKAITTSHPQAYAAWVAYQNVLSGLRSNDESVYKVSANSALEKANVAVSFAMGVTLDHYVWCRCEGRLNGPYLFSDLQLVGPRSGQ